MKLCSEIECNLPCFGGGYCKRHQYKRTDKANKQYNKPSEQRSQKKRYNIPPRKKNVSKSVKNDIKYSWGYKNQKELFDAIWEEREHACKYTGRDLNKVPKSYRHWTMAHILPKGTYTYFKLNPNNIELVHPEFHTLVDNWIEDYREQYDYDFDSWFDLQEKMKLEYELFKKENLL